MVDVAEMTESSAFMEAYKGEFRGVLRWHQLDALWEQISTEPEGWFIYAVGESVPTVAASRDELLNFISEIDQLLHTDHDEDYCGIVYVDSFTSPSLVKIFDPANLGSVCGSSGKITLPGWVMSRIQPVDLQATIPLPNNRRRWWNRLFGNRSAA